MVDDETVAELLRDGLSDWLMLHDVVWASTRDDLNPETKRKTLRVLECLYSEGLMVPGDLGEAGLEDWPGEPAEWLRRSEAELERLAWKPMGAGFWLRLSEAGEEIAREHVGKRP